MSKPQKPKPNQAYSNYGERETGPPAAANPPAAAPPVPPRPVKPQSNAGIALAFSVVALVLAAALLLGVSHFSAAPMPGDLPTGQQALFTGISHVTASKNLLLAAGLAGIAALFGLFFSLWGTDNRMNRRVSEIQESLQSLPSMLQEFQTLRNAMQNLSNDIPALRDKLAENHRMTEAVQKVVTAPDFRPAPDQLERIKEAVKAIQNQVSAIDRKLAAAAPAAAPLPARLDFDPVGATPAQRLEKAIAQFEQRLASPGKPAQANLNALKQAAQDSLAMEARLDAEAKTLLNPADLWIWDILDRDVYAAPALPVGWQEIPENEAKPLTQMSEELIRYRRFLVQKLDSRYSVKRMETLPNQTRFDTALHRADEFSKVKTTDPALNLLIAGVRAAGFTRNGEILRKPQVAYYLYTAEANAPFSAPQDSPADSAPPQASPSDSAPPPDAQAAPVFTAVPPPADAPLSSDTPTPADAPVNPAPASGERNAEAPANFGDEPETFAPLAPLPESSAPVSNPSARRESPI